MEGKPEVAVRPELKVDQFIQAPRGGKAIRTHEDDARRVYVRLCFDSESGRWGVREEEEDNPLAGVKCILVNAKPGKTHVERNIRIMRLCKDGKGVHGSLV